MRIFEIKGLLRRYKEQKCTIDDLHQLHELLNDPVNEDLIQDLMMEEMEESEQNAFTDQNSPNADFKKIFNKTELRLDQIEQVNLNYQRPAKSRFIQILRIAAICLFIFAAGVVSSLLIQNKKTVETQVISYNEIKAPLGSRSEVTLPDGSVVWLNAGSKIRYLNVFNRQNRDIELEGEAYFKVAKNPDMPFNVQTGDLNIVAIGTEFNVKAYEDEGIIETTLVEGKVSIRRDKQTQKRSMIFLEPHQKAVYVKENRQLTIEDLKTVRQTKPEVLALKKGIIYVAEKVDPAPIISWKDNRLILKGEEFSNLLIKLERKYDVTFIYESDKIKHFRFSGTLEDETLTQVLDVIKLSAPIDYELEGKTVTIFENEQMSRKFSGHLKKK